jgi:2-keto-4-pentenoate hydratase
MALTPEQLLRHHDAASYWSAGCGLSLDAAYGHALAVRALRIARGEQPAGFKVGFTNRGIWDRYGVHAPIWGTVYATTLSFCDGEGALSLAATCQPRLEPECVFGMAATPPAGADLDALFACIAWCAPGFEIVQSHLPQWKFAAPDTVADGGLHAHLLVGTKIPVRSVGADAGAFEARLAGAGVALRRDGADVDSGTGANVLDGPLHALLHFAQALAACPGAPALRAGDVVTTGTWTDAFDVAPGQSWTAHFDAPLKPLTVHFRP